MVSEDNMPKISVLAEYSEVQRLVNDKGYMPFIKQEVKHIIKKRRQSQQKGDIILDLSPKPPKTPSAEDLIMQAERRNRNNKAARKYRRNLRHRHDIILKEQDKLKEDRERLEKEIKQLRKDKQELLAILNSLPDNCCKFGERTKHYGLTVHRTEPLRDFKMEPCMSPICFGLESHVCTRDMYWELEMFNRPHPNRLTEQQSYLSRHVSVSSTGSVSPRLDSAREDSCPYTPQYMLL